jgi:hypothetical protein
VVVLKVVEELGANQQQVLGLDVLFASLNISCENAGTKPFC